MPAVTARVLQAVALCALAAALYLAGLATGVRQAPPERPPELAVDVSEPGRFRVQLGRDVAYSLRCEDMAVQRTGAR